MGANRCKDSTVREMEEEKDFNDKSGVCIK